MNRRRFFSRLVASIAGLGVVGTAKAKKGLYKEGCMYCGKVDATTDEIWQKNTLFGIEDLKTGAKRLFCVSCVIKLLDKALG